MDLLYPIDISSVFWLFEDVHDQDYWAEYVKLYIENEEEYIKWCKSIKRDAKINQLINKHNSEIEIRKVKEKNKFKDYLPFSV